MAVAYDFGSVQFDDAVRAAGRRAFAETLAAGLPVFYYRRRRSQCHGARRWPKIRDPLASGRPIRRKLRSHPRIGGTRRLRQRAHSHGNRRSERIRKDHAHAICRIRGSSSPIRRVRSRATWIGNASGVTGKCAESRSGAAAGQLADSSHDTPLKEIGPLSHTAAWRDST
jgi:hypothetical protein